MSKDFYQNHESFQLPSARDLVANRQAWTFASLLNKAGVKLPIPFVTVIDASDVAVQGVIVEWGKYSTGGITFEYSPMEGLLIYGYEKLRGTKTEQWEYQEPFCHEFKDGTMTAEQLKTVISDVAEFAPRIFTDELVLDEEIEKALSVFNAFKNKPLLTIDEVINGDSHAISDNAIPET